jgi:hypothetical protein
MSQEPTQFAERRPVARTDTVERRVLAVVAILLLHLLVLVGGVVVATGIARVGDWRSTRTTQSGPTNTVAWRLAPREPLLVMAVSLVMAHCSLGAIWWARTNGSQHARVLLVAVSCAGMWLLLLLLLETTRHSGVAAAAWGACLATLTILTALGATAYELATNYRESAARYRFSIGFLLIWTTVIALLLGGGGAWATHHGWKISDVPGWTYFAQLQGVGLASALLASGVYVNIRRPRKWPTRSLGCLATILAIAVAGPLLLSALFGDQVGATMADMVWLFGGQGLFLIAALIPLELAAVVGWDQAAPAAAGPPHVPHISK